MTSLPPIKNLGRTVEMFNQGCAAFRRAMQAWENKELAKYESALLSAARDVPDALEWALKIYLRRLSTITPEDRAYLKEPSFNQLMLLLERYADPPVDRETINHLYDCRDIRNESTHKAVVASPTDLENAIRQVRQFMLTYLPLEPEHLAQVTPSPAAAPPPTAPPPSQPARGGSISIGNIGGSISGSIIASGDVIMNRNNEVETRKEGLKRLIRKHEQRLQILKEQQATMGINVDPRIPIEIRDIETELEKLQAELDSLGDSLPETPLPAGPSPSTPSSRLRHIKIKNLETRLETLIADYEAAGNQLNHALSEVDRNRLKRQVESLEQEISQVEEELEALEAKIVQPQAKQEVSIPVQSAETSPHPIIFISYSQDDEKEKDTLLRQLKVLQSAGLITTWNNGQIGAGADWEQEIEQALAEAKVVILLVSASFLTSDFIQGVEVPAMLRRRQQSGMIVFPVIARACAWKNVEWLQRMQIRPRNGRPVWSDGGSHVDEDLAAIVEEIATVVRPATTKPRWDR